MHLCTDASTLTRLSQCMCSILPACARFDTTTTSVFVHLWVCLQIPATARTCARGFTLCLILARPHPLISCFKSLYAKRPQLTILPLFMINGTLPELFTLLPVPLQPHMFIVQTTHWLVLTKGIFHVFLQFLRGQFLVPGHLFTHVYTNIFIIVLGVLLALAKFSKSGGDRQTERKIIKDAMKEIRPLTQV